MEAVLTRSTNQPLVDLVDLLNIQKEMKKDMVIKGAGITYKDNKLWVQEKQPSGGFPFVGYVPTDLCHRQIAEKLGIPLLYYKKMQVSYPELLEYNINMWLAKDEQIKYLLRAFDGGKDQEKNIARAMLSNSFNILDNHDVLFAALDAIKEMGVKVQITKAVVTEKRMYLHVICPDVEIQAESFLKDYLRSNNAAGNGIISGMVIANSEVGLGSFEISPRGVIVKCNNGLMLKDQSFRRVHLGSRMDVGTINWSDKSKQKNFELVMSQTTDAVKTFLSSEYLGKMIEKVETAHQVVLNHPIDTIQHVCKELAINEDHKRDILKYFCEDGDSRASGVFQAITRVAQTMNPDLQYELESAAFGILPKIKKYDKVWSTN